MPLFFLVVGVAFLVTAINGTSSQLVALLEKDFFTNKPSFAIWALAVAAVGSISLIPGLKPVSNMLLLLVLAGILLSNKGFFTQFEQATGIGS